MFRGKYPHISIFVIRQSPTNGSETANFEIDIVWYSLGVELPNITLHG